MEAADICASVSKYTPPWVQHSIYHGVRRATWDGISVAPDGPDWPNCQRSSLLQCKVAIGFAVLPAHKQSRKRALAIDLWHASQSEYV
jgi:hypothetical protein